MHVNLSTNPAPLNRICPLVTLAVILSWSVPSRAEAVYTFRVEGVPVQQVSVVLGFAEPPASGSMGWTFAGGFDPPEITTAGGTWSRLSPAPFAIGGIEGGGFVSLTGAALDLGSFHALGAFPGGGPQDGISLTVDIRPEAGADRVGFVSRSFSANFLGDFTLTSALPAPSGVVLLGLGLGGVAMARVLGRWRAAA
jgi:hypothetical protein